LGQRGESAAARYLKRRGYRILAQGDRSRWGEIDLIAVDKKRTIVFVEVKTRQSADAGHPSEAVDDGKQGRLTRLAVTYLKRHGLLEYPARFDVIAVTWPPGQRRPQIEHFPNAFDVVGKGGLYS
jgi:putative endonuclease